MELPQQTSSYCESDTAQKQKTIFTVETEQIYYTI